MADVIVVLVRDVTDSAFVGASVVLTVAVVVGGGGAAVAAVVGSVVVEVACAFVGAVV